MDDTGRIITEKQKILEAWKRYITKLFKDNRPEKLKVGYAGHTDEGPDILKDEVLKAVRPAKTRKAAYQQNSYK